MPLYFTTVAPTCPVSRDGVHGPARDLVLGRVPMRAPTVPKAYDLQSALQSANIARTIVQSLVFQKTINNIIDNIHMPEVNGRVTVAPDKYKTKTARWTEQTNKRVKRKYKYYAKDTDGTKNKDIYITMERIERMVWYDKGWKAYMVWEYGDKGEGEPVR